MSLREGNSPSDSGVAGEDARKVLLSMSLIRHDRERKEREMLDA